MEPYKNFYLRAVIVAQLVEQLLPIPEVRGSNPVIGKNLYWTSYCQLYWKDENKEKEAGKGQFFEKKNFYLNNYKWQ